jgi:hypothetical protein
MDGFDPACGHIAQVPRAKNHQAHFFAFGHISRTTSVNAEQNDNLPDHHRHQGQDHDSSSSSFCPHVLS